MFPAEIRNFWILINTVLFHLNPPSDFSLAVPNKMGYFHPSLLDNNQSAKTDLHFPTVVPTIFEQQSCRDKNRYNFRCCLRYPQSLCPYKQGQPEYGYCLNDKGAHERNNSRDFTIIEPGEVSRGIDVKTLKDEGKRKEI